MATPTYDFIDSVTLGTAASSVTFSSITQDYRDLVLVAEPISDSGTIATQMRYNGDTGNNYYMQYMKGDGSSASSSNNNSSRIFLYGDSTADATGEKQLIKIEILDYSAIDKHKPAVNRMNNADSGVDALATRWASTSAITSIEIYTSVSNFATGSTFYLYGIEA